MKKNVWIILITIITVCCMAGGIFYHLGVRGSRIWGRGKTTDTSTALEAFDKIDVDAELMDVTITEGERFYLSCAYSNGLEPVYEVKEGMLTIRQQPYRSWGIHSTGHCSLTLTIPAGTALDAVEVQTALGNVYTEKIIASKCELQSNMGNCSAQDCSFDEADLNTNLGEVFVKNTSLGEAKANSDMGTIKVEASTFDSLDVTASMGDIKVDSAQKLDEYDMELTTEMGSVRVNNRDEGTKYHQSGDAGELELDTSMGSIRLTY